MAHKWKQAQAAMGAGGSLLDEDDSDDDSDDDDGDGEDDVEQGGEGEQEGPADEAMAEE
jgi:hypothetical protein